jgi:hypothetical protein
MLPSSSICSSSNVPSDKYVVSHGFAPACLHAFVEKLADLLVLLLQSSSDKPWNNTRRIALSTVLLELEIGDATLYRRCSS